ncbi:DUF6042 family protein [Phytohabitans rumicis]|uniref:Uncharacterized protein n=1 Tax=Phytohabitans rumicis TaxID=1076125 RepID=A0A6V8LBY0_9ACTN|nr:DUF6042 family protein [Phytohabitans rumicis]GFJ93140.1 hypothetical protein Prum_067820 [Phytohabitans rumicis]
MTAPAPEAGEPIRVPVLFQLGWFRWLPHAGFDFEELLHRFPGTPREEVLAAQRVWNARRNGADLDQNMEPAALAASLPAAPAWAPPDPPADGDPDEDFAAEVTHHANRVAAYNELLDRMGLRPVETAEQVLDLMVTIGLVHIDEHDDQQPMRLTVDPPLPTEALDMTPEERSAEDRMRWRSRHARLAQKVLRLFIDPASSDLARTTVPATLSRLANTTGAEPEDVRHAVQVLLDDGDFAAHRFGVPVDLERVHHRERFDLVVDPERFDRMHVHLNRPVVRPDA